MGRGFGFLARVCLLLAVCTTGCKSIPYLNFSFDLALEARTPDELDGVFVILVEDNRLNETDDAIELTMPGELSQHIHWEHFVIDEDTGLFTRYEGSYATSSIEIEPSEEGPTLEISIKNSLLEQPELQRASLLIVAESGHENADWSFGSREMLDAEDTVQLSIRGLEFRKAL